MSSDYSENNEYETQLAHKLRIAAFCLLLLSVAIFPFILMKSTHSVELQYRAKHQSVYNESSSETCPVCGREFSNTR